MPNLDNVLRFGICPRCSRAGLDDDDGSRLTGYELKEYRGEYMCELCIMALQDSEYDKDVNQTDIEFEQFKNAIGTKNEPQ